MRQANIPACLIFTATGFQRRVAKEAAAWMTRHFVRTFIPGQGEGKLQTPDCEDLWWS